MTPILSKVLLVGAMSVGPSLPAPPVTFVLSNGGQTAELGERFSPLVVTVLDQNGDPVPNHVVFFGIASGGGIFCAITAGTLLERTEFFGNQVLVVTSSEGVAAIEVAAWGLTGPARVGVASGVQEGLPDHLAYFDLTIEPGPFPGNAFDPLPDCEGYAGPPGSVPATVATTAVSAVATASTIARPPDELPATGTGVWVMVVTAAVAVGLGTVLLSLRRGLGRTRMGD